MWVFLDTKWGMKVVQHEESFLRIFCVKRDSCGMTLWEGTSISHISDSSLITFWGWFDFFFLLLLPFWASFVLDLVPFWGCQRMKYKFLSFWRKLISFDRALCIDFLSNYHGLPNKTWQASVETISHKTSFF